MGDAAVSGGPLVRRQVDRGPTLTALTLRLAPVGALTACYTAGRVIDTRVGIDPVANVSRDNYVNIVGRGFGRRRNI